MTNKSSENHEKIQRPQKNYYTVYDSKICRESGILKQWINQSIHTVNVIYRATNQAINGILKPLKELVHLQVPIHRH